ncbi:hypothetical protein ABKN59_008764 [Abortiporus biennis]
MLAVWDGMAWKQRHRQCVCLMGFGLRNANSNFTSGLARLSNRDRSRLHVKVGLNTSQNNPNSFLTFCFRFESWQDCDSLVSSTEEVCESKNYQTRYHDATASHYHPTERFPRNKIAFSPTLFQTDPRFLSDVPYVTSFLSLYLYRNSA